MSRQERLTNLLKSRKCFKLVCGAGNEDAVEVEKLVALYAKAGARYFDLSPREDVVLAAKKAVQKMFPPAEQVDYFFNVSVGLKGDPHARKAFIVQDKCLKCGLCARQCPQSAIMFQNDEYNVLQKKCIGCGICARNCPAQTINLIHQEADFKQILPPLFRLGLDSLELHASTPDEELTQKQWRELGEMFNGILSLCVDRSNLSDRALIQRIKSAITERGAFTTIIQADGAPMSGSDDNVNTTLQAVAIADLVEKAGLPVWILLSGGTNSKTAGLAAHCAVSANGVSLGSYARKIVKKYTERDDFFENKEIFNQALVVAKDLVDKTLSYL